MPRKSVCAPVPSIPPAVEAAPLLRRVRGPSPQKTELTRSEIVTAAIAEFMEVGIAKATMDKIAKRAKLAKGTLYLHFASKEDLLLGALQVTFAQSALPYLQAQRLPKETVRAYLLRLVVPSMERFHHSVRPDLARLMLGEAKSYPVLARFYHEQIFQPWHQHFEAMLQTALDEGELQGILPATAARLMGAPFWFYLASDSIGAPVPEGCSPGELSRAQIEGIFGTYAPIQKARRKRTQSTTSAATDALR